MKNLNAFTLAEVLITLGIIGVVAAMTMPTLINQTNGAQYKAAFKKALSSISQGVTLNVALDDYDFKDLSGASGSGNGTMLELLQKRMNVVKNSTGNITNYSPKDASDNALAYSDNTAVYFNDGTMFVFAPATTGCTRSAKGVVSGTSCKGFIDVNGIKGPNKMVKCSSGSGNTCAVDIPTDIYPVIFYDQAILPNSHAARAVLYGKS